MQSLDHVFTLQRHFKDLDAEVAGFESELFRDKLLQLPIELWGHILWKAPTVRQHENLLSVVPDLPSPEVQARYAGTSGMALLPKAHDFVRVFEGGVGGVLAKPLRNLSILDYGCGWGRLSRFFLRYCIPGELVCADPGKFVIDLLRESNFPAEIKLIDAVPDRLPFDRKFDVVNLFSIFTHLPDWLVSLIMERLRDCVKPSGVVVFTIRPSEFWPYYHSVTKDDRFSRAVEEHNEKGYVFFPASLKSLGPSTYGESSFTHEFLMKRLAGWQLVRTEISSADPFQIIYFVRPI